MVEATYKPRYIVSGLYCTSGVDELSLQVVHFNRFGTQVSIAETTLEEDDYREEVLYCDSLSNVEQQLKSRITPEKLDAILFILMEKLQYDWYVNVNENDAFDLIIDEELINRVIKNNN